MSSPDDDVQRWFAGLSYKVKRELAQTIKDEADGLADAIKAAAPVKSGALRDSVKVRRKKNDLDLEVTAGGAATTKGYERSTDYSSVVVVDGRDNSGKSKVAKGSGSGVEYDYAMATEFGTSKEEAQPFFYPTYRERAPQIRENIEAAVEKAINS